MLPEPFLCQALPSLSLSGAGGFVPALLFHCLSASLFLQPGLSAGCAFGVGCWLLPLAPPFWIPSFDFQVWGVAVAGAWSPSGVFLGVALLRLARASFLYKVIKGYRRRKSAISLYF